MPRSHLTNHDEDTEISHECPASRAIVEAPEPPGGLRTAQLLRVRRGQELVVVTQHVRSAPVRCAVAVGMVCPEHGGSAACLPGPAASIAEIGNHVIPVLARPVEMTHHVRELDSLAVHRMHVRCTPSPAHDGSTCRAAWMLAMARLYALSKLLSRW